MLPKLDQQANICERLSVQLGLFYKYKDQDEDIGRSNCCGVVNVNSHYELFETIMGKVQYSIIIQFQMATFETIIYKLIVRKNSKFNEITNNTSIFFFVGN